MTEETTVENPAARPPIQIDVSVDEITPEKELEETGQKPEEGGAENPEEEQKEPTAEEKAAKAEKQRERQRKRADRNLFKYEQQRARAEAAERRLSEIRKAQAEMEQSGGPKLEDFENKPYGDYLKAVARYEAKLESNQSKISDAEAEIKDANDSLTAEEQEEYRELQQAVHENIEQARKTFPDMDEVTAKYGQMPIPEDIWRCFQNTENPGFALYSVMKDGALAEICAMNPYQAAMTIARHEDKAIALSKPKTVSTAPAPRTSSRGGAGTGSKDPHDMTDDEFNAWRRESIAKRHRR